MSITTVTRSRATSVLTDDAGNRLSMDQLSERYRAQILHSFGGWKGMLLAAIPTIVYVAVNAAWGLHPAFVAATGTALALVLAQLLQGEPMRQAVAGLAGVLIAVGVAEATGQARNYFIVSIITSVAYGSAFLVSMVLRRPLVGVIWEFLDPHDGRCRLGLGRRRRTQVTDAAVWYARPRLMRAHQLATLGMVVLYATRTAVQIAFWSLNSPGWLGLTQVVMGYPLWVAALMFAFAVVRRARAAEALPA